MKKRIVLFCLCFLFTNLLSFGQCTNGTVMCSEITTSSDSLCAAGNINIDIIGGSLGIGSEWELYSGSCGGTLIATTSTNTFLNIPVGSNTTFYCKADSCDVTVCVNLDVYVLSASFEPTSLSISNDTLCSAGNVTFTVNGGALGTSAQWELFSGSCGGSIIDSSFTGTLSNVAVSNTTTYYLRANGYCNTTNCAAVNFVLADSSFISNGILSSDTIICQNDNITLTVDGGSLGTGGQWKWFDDFCGGNNIGQGNSINLNQSVTSNYSVRAEGLCNTTNCSNITITTLPHYIELDSLSIDSVMNPIDSSWYIPDSVCPQSPVQLFAHYNGLFPNSYSITWYENSCGSTPINVGDSIIVYPDSTTTYYARVVGACGASLCKSVIVKTKDGSLAATGVTASANNFCTGGSSTLTVVGGFLGSSSQWKWYKGSCSGTSIGSGNSIIVTPASTTTYFVRATGGSCGNTACNDVLINTYDLNMYHSPLDPTCESSTIVLEGGFPLGGTYSGVGITDSLFDPAIAGIGTHTITYSFSDGNNCTDSIQTTIDVLQHNPDPMIISASSYEICNGNSTTLSLDTNSILISGSKWVWYKEACSTGTVIDSTENLDTLWVNQIDTTYSSINYTQVSPNTTTNYYVRSEGGQCPPSNCIGLTVDVYTLETHVNKFDDVCGTATPEFSLQGGDPSGGIYSGNGITNNTFYPLLADTGTHNITYTITLGSCIATDNETINVTNSPVNVYHSIEQETCAEGGIMIHAHPINGTGFYSYQWDDGSLESPLTYASAGYHSVLVADGNNCYTLLDSIIVDSSLTCIEMVNTFSPNGDGLNDYWSLDFSNYESVDLMIFNKWGNVIKQFNNTIIQWDAVYEGNALPSGTYYYIVKLTTPNGESIEQNGPITIIR